MSRGVSNKITYKPYSQNEQWLLPPSLDEEEIKEAAAKINERLAEINDLDDEESKGVKKN